RALRRGRRGVGRRRADREELVPLIPDAGLQPLDLARQGRLALLPLPLLLVEGPLGLGQGRRPGLHLPRVPRPLRLPPVRTRPPLRRGQAPLPPPLRELARAQLGLAVETELRLGERGPGLLQRLRLPVQPVPAGEQLLLAPGEGRLLSLPVPAPAQPQP